MSDLSLTLQQIVTLFVVAAIPTGLWRVSGVLLARRISSQSEIFEWVRFVATTLLAGVVAKLLFNPSSVLELVPLWVRLGAILAAFLVFMLCKRSVLIGVLVGEIVVIATLYFIQG